MTELEKIKFAKTIIDKLSNGFNPIDDQPLAETDIVNNVRLSRCFFFVSDILRQVIEAGGVNPAKKSAKNPFYITQEQLAEFRFSPYPIPISEIAKRLNEIISDDDMKSLSHRKITEWLVSIGALSETENSNGKPIKSPTEEGEKLGISVDFRHGMYGDYRVVVYSRDAQQFIIDNMDAILGLADSKQ